MQTAKIYPSPNKDMDGLELYRLRKGVKPKLSQEGLANRMTDLGWNWSQKDVSDFEIAFRFSISPLEMVDLLKSLNAKTP